MKKIFNEMVLGAILILYFTGSPVVAAEFPTKAVTIIIPMSPGGARDIQCRAFASVAEKVWGQPVVPVNRPGASGLIGLLAGAKAAPDGYTLTSASIADICALEWEITNSRTPSVTRNDFVSLGMFTLFPDLIIVPYDSPWRTLADLIREAKAKPGHDSFSSGGMYAAGHVATESFMEAAGGLKFRHVPYAGGGPAVTAIVGKHVDFGLATPSSCLSFLQGKKLRALAVTSEKRYPVLPDLPTLQELGIYGADFYGWVGMFAPLKTPEPVLGKLRETMKTVSEDASFIKMIEAQGDIVNFRNADEMAKHIEYESAQVSKLYKRLIAESKEKK
jgi:tripartite-type tricarboxylate transporter receptor subunit TctC